MKFEKPFFILIIYLISNNLYSQKIDVGILGRHNPKKIFIEAASGKYKIKCGDKSIYRLKKNRSIILNYANGYINVSNAKKDFGLYKNVTIINKKYKFDKSHNQSGRKNGELSLKMIDPKLEAKVYQGNLHVKILDKSMLLVNKLGLEDYLAGVVETESGPNSLEEYYKNQAVICRTYALKSSDKHKAEGFNLCDGVHCQAYKGKSVLNPIIPKAVNNTSKLVIVDEKNELIGALFSANCGGQTNNSEDVWANKLSYLRSINDQFCIDQRQATWTKIIDKQDFINFLKEKNIEIADTIPSDSLAFEQSARKTVYTINNQEIKLTTLRNGLNLRSTFFSIKPNGEKLILNGRGYGHGVGMCQEGAMNMAKKGYKYDQIIKYYYKNVNLVSIDKLKGKVPYY